MQIETTAVLRGIRTFITVTILQHADRWIATRTTGLHNDAQYGTVPVALKNLSKTHKLAFTTKLVLTNTNQITRASVDRNQREVSAHIFVVVQTRLQVDIGRINLGEVFQHAGASFQRQLQVCSVLSFMPM